MDLDEFRTRFGKWMKKAHSNPPGCYVTDFCNGVPREYPYTYGTQAAWADDAVSTDPVRAADVATVSAALCSSTATPTVARIAYEDYRYEYAIDWGLAYGTTRDGRWFVARARECGPHFGVVVATTEARIVASMNDVERRMVAHARSRPT
jgi:hypothetical protein